MGNGETLRIKYEREVIHITSLRKALRFYPNYFYNLAVVFAIAFNVLKKLLNDVKS